MTKKTLMQHARDGYRLGKSTKYDLPDQRRWGRQDERPVVSRSLWRGVAYGSLFAIPFWIVVGWFVWRWFH
jgi:hypothetical protein